MIKIVKPPQPLYLVNPISWSFYSYNTKLNNSETIRKNIDYYFYFYFIKKYPLNYLQLKRGIFIWKSEALSLQDTLQNFKNFKYVFYVYSKHQILNKKVNEWSDRINVIIIIMILFLIYLLVLYDFAHHFERRLHFFTLFSITE